MGEQSREPSSQSQNVLEKKKALGLCGSAVKGPYFYDVRTEGKGDDKTDRLLDRGSVKEGPKFRKFCGPHLSRAPRRS